jgi:hypothetical protein
MNCKHCGKEFEKTSSTRKRFCSDKCKCANWKATKGKEPAIVKCVDCGAEVMTTESKKGIQHRCDECTRLRREAQRLSDKERQERAERRREEARLSYYTNGKRDKLIAKRKVIKCGYCGKEFKQEHLSQIYCSSLCAKRSAKKNEHAKERITKHSGLYNHVRFNEVWERDKGLCRICGKPIDKTLPPTDSMALNIDHIIPVSVGGSHCIDNVQLSHRACNINKGNAM